MGIFVITAVAILGILHCFVQGSLLQEKMIVLQNPNGNRSVVVITWKEDDSDSFYCRISTDPDLIQEALKISGVSQVLRPTTQEMQEVEKECDSFRRQERREISDEKENDVDAIILDSPSAPQIFNWNLMIFPGTKWCGAGDIAKHDDDLGFHEDTDRCCRAHDKCDDVMLAGEKKNGLKNKSPFTALSCKCDYDFYDCLDRINSLTSNTVGHSYFNLLRSRCYAKDYPLSKKCKKYRTILKLTCLEYARDTNAPQVFQWFSAKKYKKLPFPGPWTIDLPF